MTSADTATTRTSYHRGKDPSDDGGSAGRTSASTEPSTAARARAIGRKFNHEKLPLSTSQAWVTTITTAAAVATGSGANSSQGTTTWAKWLARASIRWRGFGRWWNRQLRGFGIGW